MRGESSEPRRPLVWLPTWARMGFSQTLAFLFPSRRQSVLADQQQYFGGGGGDVGAGAKDRADADFFEEGVVAARDDAAADDEDVAGAVLFECVDQRGDERL